MNYNTRNVKKTRGREGIGYTASLYRDETLVATVENWADGGPTQINWRNADEKSAFDAYAATQTYVDYRGETVPSNDEIVVDDLITIANLQKEFKTKTIFNHNGKTFTMKGLYTAAQIQGRYAGAVVLNYIPIQEALKLIDG